MPKAARVQAVLPGAAQAVAQVQEPLVVAQRLVAECLGRAQQCQEPARRRPCRDNRQPDRQAMQGTQQALQPARECPVKKAHQRILPGSQGPAQVGNRQAWDRALPQGLARLERVPVREDTDF